MRIKVILVSKENEAKNKYLKAIEKLNVQVDVVSSFSDLRGAMVNTAYNGVMIDFLTKMKASGEEKTIAHEILEVFPVVQLKWDKNTNSIQTLYFGQSKSWDTLEDFITKQCESFTARSIRLTPRKRINFNVLLSKQPNLNKENIIRTVTIDMSRGGCFLFSTENWKSGDPVWFVFKEMDDVTPMYAAIRRVVPWGKNMQYPGIGVAFKKVKKAQIAFVCEKYKI